MLNPRNNGNLVGGLVADPELVNDGKIARLRVGVDWAGNDRKNPENKSGYFNVTYFLNNEGTNAKFVRDQIAAGNLKKGSQVHIIYRLVHDRWETDGQNQSAVTLIAEALSYAGTGTSESTTKKAGASVDVPAEF